MKQFLILKQFVDSFNFVYNNLVFSHFQFFSLFPQILSQFVLFFQSIRWLYLQKCTALHKLFEFQNIQFLLLYCFAVLKHKIAFILMCARSEYFRYSSSFSHWQKILKISSFIAKIGQNLFILKQPAGNMINYNFISFWNFTIFFSINCH